MALNGSINFLMDPMRSIFKDIVLRGSSASTSLNTVVIVEVWEHGFYFFALDPKLVPKTGNLRCGNKKIRETG
jgi:hypothetical protein